MSFLGNQKWQGISAIASLGCLVIAYLTFVERPLPPVPPREYPIASTDRTPKADPIDTERGQQRRLVRAPASQDHERRAHIETTDRSTGGFRIIASGLGSAGSEFRSSVAAELESLGWEGLMSGNELHVNGSIRDAGLTLGQIVTARGSASWELRSSAGTMIAQGGVADKMGTGMDDAEAHAATVNALAKQIAHAIVREIP